MKRLVHADEAERRSAPKRTRLGAAIAVAGLMGAAGCAAVTTPPPRYSLMTGETARMTAYGADIFAFRLRENISVMEGRDAPHWIEERSGGGYRSLMIISYSENFRFTGAAFVENDGRWNFAGIVSRYSMALRALRGTEARPPPHMDIREEDGICRMDAEPFRSLVRQVSGREVARMEPISDITRNRDYQGNFITRYLIHLVPLDSGGNKIGQYMGGQLALTTGYAPTNPEYGCSRDITLLLEPGAEDPRNMQK